MTKCAGVTWYNDNYGSILQAYALQAFINAIPGMSYELLRYRRKDENVTKKIKGKSISEIVKAVYVRKLIPEVKARRHANAAFVDTHLSFSDCVYTPETIAEANKKYDVFFCGSDQIWNPSIKKVDDFYYLSFANDNKKKIAYAPSLGVSEMSSEDAERFHNALLSFSAISTREPVGTDFVNRLLGAEVCKTVSDPTIMVPRSTWDDIASDRLVQEKYIFAYMLRGTREDREAIERFAKEENLKIVTVPYLDVRNIEKYDKTFGDIRLSNISPADFIALIRDAEYVFTDSFHCSVFSTLYHVPYFAFRKTGKEEQSARIINLQNLSGIEEGFITPETKAETIRAKADSIDWSSVDERIDSFRKTSQQYLLEVLEEPK